MSSLRVVVVTTLAMLAFAGNSLLCRLALTRTTIDPASFTLLRLASGAAMLLFLTRIRQPSGKAGGNWLSAAALFAYAAGFSFAYISLSTATGALLLFAAVQVTMMSWALARGERLNLRQGLALGLAVAGFIILLFPGLKAPSPSGAILMILAGVAWGVYSLRGSGSGGATRETAGNFLRATPMAVVASLILLARASADLPGITCAIASGALASGMGYALWYTVLPRIRASTAATVQLSVPSLAALGGVLLLGEPLTSRLLLAAAATFAGVLLFSLNKQIQKPLNPVHQS